MGCLILKEVWRPIIGYEEYYKISNQGKVLNLRNNKLMKLYTDKNGYYKVNLSNNGKKKKFAVHRLVALHFQYWVVEKDLPYDKLQVDHIDTNKNNNSLENLHLVTAKGNHNNPLTKINMTKENHSMAKPVLCITTGKVFNYIKEAEEFYNIPSGSIGQCCKGRYRSAGKLPDGTKLVWKYL